MIAFDDGLYHVWVWMWMSAEEVMRKLQKEGILAAASCGPRRFTTSNNIGKVSSRPEEELYGGHTSVSRILPPRQMGGTGRGPE